MAAASLLATLSSRCPGAAASSDLLGMAEHVLDEHDELKVSAAALDHDRAALLVLVVNLVQQLLDAQRLDATRVMHLSVRALFMLGGCPGPLPSIFATVSILPRRTGSA